MYCFVNLSSVGMWGQHDSPPSGLHAKVAKMPKICAEIPWKYAGTDKLGAR